MATLPTTIVGITLPTSPTITSALKHIQSFNLPSTVNHCIRSAIFSLLIASKHPSLSNNINAESLLLATLLHDLGWSPTHTSPDARFEVDGANAAHTFLSSLPVPNPTTTPTSTSTPPPTHTTTPDLQQIWYAIALHTTPSLALHAPHPLVSATAWGIMADFLGPSTPPGNAITAAEFTEVLRAYPRVGFKEETLGILCGLCRNKPKTTYDNFVGDVGRKWVEGYVEGWEAARFDRVVWGALEGNEVYES